MKKAIECNPCAKKLADIMSYDTIKNRIKYEICKHRVKSLSR